MQQHNSAIAMMALATTIITTPVLAGDDSLSGFIRDGETQVALRYRMESVQQDNPLDDALASTLRTRITVQSDTIADSDLLLEADNVSIAGAREYDSLMQNRYRGTHSIIADPPGTEINQARLRFRPDKHHTISAGRQRINHANQRFLGGVGWRQNEQTYDAIRYQYDNDQLSVDYAWLTGVNRIFDGRGTSIQATHLDSDSHAVRASTPLGPGRLSGWAYLLDFENAPALSSRTLGLSWTWTSERVDVTLEHGWQSDHGSAVDHFDTRYSRIALNARAGGFQWLLSREVLGSDGGRRGFSTPLATLHAFQGFTDLFLTTPPRGLEDLRARVSRSWQDLSLAVGWHKFRAETSGGEYGSEWNITASYRFSPLISFQLKAASYAADQHAVDTDKIWSTMNVSL